MRITVVSWIVSVLALVGLVAWLGTGVLKFEHHTNMADAAIGGPFSLLDGNGNRVTDKDFRGRYMLIFFGFTHCPDICPTTLLLFNNALGNLGKKASQVAPIFITVDPERDTPKVVGPYVKHFGDRIIGLSGTPEEIAKTTAAYKVYVSKLENENSSLGYMMEHSGFIYLMGPDGKYIAHFPQSIPEQSLTEQIAAHIR